MGFGPVDGRCRRSRARGLAPRRGRRVCHAVSRVAETASSSAVPDVLAPNLSCVFCGINPGRVSAAAGAHFANPRNDFWRLLHDAGFTPRLYAPAEQNELLALGYGVTNAAYRTTPGSGDLRRGDFDGERLVALAGSAGWLIRGRKSDLPKPDGPQIRGQTALFAASTSPGNGALRSGCGFSPCASGWAGAAGGAGAASRSRAADAPSSLGGVGPRLVDHPGGGIDSGRRRDCASA